MSDTISVDLAQANYIMDIQNGSNSLVTSSSHEPTNVTPPLSSPDSGGENTEYISSPSIIYRPPHPYEHTVLMMMHMPEGVPASEQTPISTSPPQEANLLTLLRNQLEYYFSKDNLATDKYLLSQMDGDHFVPISILASFNQVKRLSNDMNLITEAIKESNSLQLDSTNTKVRAIPEKRCILILREIPKETPKEDVFNLFAGEGCPNFISCDFAENDCWYVTFCSEEEAQEAYRYLREEVREFLGKPIRARIKNTAVQRAATLPKPRPQYPFSTVQPVSYYQQPVSWPYFPADQSYAQYMNGFPPQGASFGGGPPQSGPRFGLPPSSTAAAMPTAVPRDVNVRKGSSSSNGGKGRHTASNDVGGERRGSSSGYSGRETRNRRDDDRDRIRNLPNRLKNKRSEEMSANSSEKRDERTDKPVDKEKTDRTGGERGYNRQRAQNRTQPKLDFAPTNFPPLPGQIDATIIPPPPPLPPSVSEEGKSNLADIVKGRRGNGMDKPLTVASPDVNPSHPPQPSTPPPGTPPTIPISQVPPVTTTTKVSTTNVATTQTTQVTKTKPDLKITVTKEQKGINTSSSKIQAPLKVNEKETTTNKYAVPKSNSVVRTQSNNGIQRNRFRESKETKKSNSSSSRPTTQRHSPKPSKHLNQAPPPPPSGSELEEKIDDPPKLEKMSYAQMAGQKKPKPSPQKTPGGSESKGSSSPPLSPNDNNQISNETITSPLLSPSLSPVQSDLPPTTSKN